MKKLTRTQLYWTLIHVGLLLLVFGLFSCGPQKKLSRLLKKHPELVRSDTVYQDVFVTVPEVKIDTSAPINPQYIDRLLGIIDTYSSQLDSFSRIKIKQEIKYITNNHSLIQDTLIYVKDGVTIKLWQQAGKIELRLFKPKEQITQKVPVKVDSVISKKEVKKFDWTFFVAGLIIGILFAYLLIKLVFY